MKRARMRTCRNCGLCDEYPSQTWTGNPDQVVSFAHIPCNRCGDDHLTIGSWVRTFSITELRNIRSDMHHRLVELYVNSAKGPECEDLPDVELCSYEELDNRTIIQRIMGVERIDSSVFYDPTDGLWHIVGLEPDGRSRLHERIRHVGL